MLLLGQLGRLHGQGKFYKLNGMCLPNVAVILFITL